MSIQSGKRAEKLTSEAEAQQICDAALEIARAALVQWRNADVHVTPPGVALSPTYYAWNKVFQQCVTADTTRSGMGAVASADVIREDALDKFGNPALWYYVPDRTYLPLTTNSTTIGTAGPPNSSTIGQGIQDLFGVNRRYGKGAFHLAMRITSATSTATASTTAFLRAGIRGGWIRPSSRPSMSTGRPRTPRCIPATP
jgi:hypothetical protein